MYKIIKDISKMNVCECCESGLAAIKVEGLFVCKKCNNFNCGICGLENNSNGYIINWSETKDMCVCDNCNEEEEEEPECYGKHCSETEGLKLCIGWNRNYCLDNKRFTENLFCDYCEKTNCYTKCVWCSETYKVTDMEYRCGGGFAHKDAYGEACMFCKECVAIIEQRLEC